MDTNLSQKSNAIPPMASRFDHLCEPFSERHARHASRARTWRLIAVLMLATLLVSVSTEFRLAWRSWLLPAALIGMLLLLGWFYDTVRRVDDGRIAETLHETALLTAYGPPAAALSYIVIAPALPLMDAHFAAADLALGFDWPALYRWVEENPGVRQALSFFYASSLPHIGAVLIATGLTGRTSRTRELNSLLIATSLPMVLISGLLPALGAWVHFGIGLEHAFPLDHVLGIREGTFRLLEVGNLLGIIAFPSFHTAITLVLVWVTRGLPWLFWPSVLLGVGQLFSIPIVGGHYLVDMLAAGIITVLAVAILHGRQRSPAQSTR